MGMVLAAQLLQIQPRERKQGGFGTGKERRAQQQQQLERQPNHRVRLCQQRRIEVEEVSDCLQVLKQQLWK
jgi:hypothetical protein